MSTNHPEQTSSGLPVIFETLFQVFSRFSRSLLSYFQGPKLSNSRFFKVYSSQTLVLGLIFDKLN